MLLERTIKVLGRVCLPGLLLLGVGLPAQPQSTDGERAILERLDRLEKQNRELLEEVQALRAQIAGRSKATDAGSVQASGTQSAATADQPVAERQEVNEHRIEELAQTKVEASQRFPVQLTGMALFNAYSNGAYSGGAVNPVVASLNPGRRSSAATLRQSVLGLKFQGPQTLWGGTVSGSIYMDFFAGTGSSLNQLFRLRLATLQFDWPNTTFAVGQDKPLVSRREPNSLAQVGVSPLTGAGNPWLWQPQARIEQRFRLTSRTTLKAEGGVFQTAETANQPSNVASLIETARPALETRIGARYQLDEDRAFEVAPVMHWSTSHVAGNSVASRLYGIDWLLKPIKELEITGLAFHGRNFANLGALGGITLVGNRAIPVHGRGGWVQFRYLATRKLTFDVYGGIQDNRDSDLTAGRIGRNQYMAGNVMYLLAPNVMAAFEVGQNRTNYVGFGNRLNNHYDLALAYLF